MHADRIEERNANSPCRRKEHTGLRAASRLGDRDAVDAGIRPVASVMDVQSDAGDCRMNKIDAMSDIKIDAANNNMHNTAPRGGAPAAAMGRGLLLRASAILERGGQATDARAQGHVPDRNVRGHLSPLHGMAAARNGGGGSERRRRRLGTAAAERRLHGMTGSPLLFIYLLLHRINTAD
jgi:hypothetical protein